MSDLISTIEFAAAVGVKVGTLRSRVSQFGNFYGVQPAGLLVADKPRSGYNWRAADVPQAILNWKLAREKWLANRQLLTHKRANQR